MRVVSLLVAALASITASAGADEPATLAQVGASAGATTAAAMIPVTIDRIAWLQGSWEGTSPRRTVEEQWMAPRAGCMINVGRTVRGDSLFEYEMVVVRERGDHLEYEAHPSGQPSAVFVSRTLTDSTVVFENLEHDFP
jgi:uncharacterized protein DUF6265